MQVADSEGPPTGPPQGEGEGLPQGEGEGEGEDGEEAWNGEGSEYYNSEYASDSEAGFSNVNWGSFEDTEAAPVNTTADFADFNWAEMSGWNTTKPGAWWSPSLANDTAYWQSQDNEQEAEGL